MYAMYCMGNFSTFANYVCPVYDKSKQMTPVYNYLFS